VLCTPAPRFKTVTSRSMLAPIFRTFDRMAPTA
jgi:hypothetical protein